jgi:hypothetical protein
MFEILSLEPDSKTGNDSEIINVSPIRAHQISRLSKTVLSTNAYIGSEFSANLIT